MRISTRYLCVSVISLMFTSSLYADPIHIAVQRDDVNKIREILKKTPKAVMPKPLHNDCPFA